jgi:hypothetical protein
MLRAVLLVLSILLQACGGGAAPSNRVQLAPMWGDSSASGHVDPQVAGYWRLPDPPARAMQRALGDGYLVVDYSMPGATVRGILDGGATLASEAFRDQLLTIKPDVIVLRAGGPDALLGTDPVQFEADVRELVRLARFAAPRVVLVGLFHLPAFQERMVLFDAILRRVAAEEGVRFADTMAVPAGELADNIHPAQPYASALLLPIVEQMR